MPVQQMSASGAAEHVAVVTGPGPGTGAAGAHRFAADGYTVEVLQPYGGLRRLYKRFTS